MYMYLTTLVILLHPIQGLAILMWLQVQYNISVACGWWSSHLLNYGRKILKNERRKILLLKGMSGEIWMLESSLLKSGDMQLNNKNFIIPYIFLCPSIDEHWTCSSPNTLSIVIDNIEEFRIRDGQLSSTQQFGKNSLHQCKTFFLPEKTTFSVRQLYSDPKNNSSAAFSCISKSHETFPSID